MTYQTDGLALVANEATAETERQYEYLEKAKEYVRLEKEKLGRPLTFCVTTFGCA